MRFEIKKLLSNKISAVLFALIMAGSFIYFASTHQMFTRRAVTPEYSAMAEQFQLEYNKQYNEHCEAVIRSAERIKAESSDKYTIRLSEKIISTCENRRELPIGDNSAVTWFKVILDDTYITLLLVIFCVLISAQLFCGDRSSGVFKLNFTAKNGRLVLYKNKILTLMIVSAFAAVLYTIVQLAVILLKYPLADINAPLQMEKAYLNCAYNIGFLEYVLVTMGTRILSCWFMCFLTGCLSLVFGNIIASAAVGAGGCVLLFILFDRTLATHGGTEVSITKYVLHHILLKFSPICLLDPNGYFISREYANVFGRPVTELAFGIAFTAVVTAALAVFGGYLFTRRRRALS